LPCTHLSVNGIHEEGRCDASLITDALMTAAWRRGKADALLHHSDQGSQYASKRFQRLLADNGITCSMSRVSNVWDNSVFSPRF
jgi:putative transposase